MLYTKLTKPEEQTLREGYKNHKKSHVRLRCHALLLSHEGMSVQQIIKITKTRSRTIYTWMQRWDEWGLIGLMILPGRGVKAKLLDTDKELIELLKKSKNIRT